MIKACSGTNCASACLRGIKYTNKLGAECLIHLNCKGIRDVCRIMSHEAFDLHIRAADLLNDTYRGHRSNGYFVIPVSTTRANDMAASKMMYLGKIVRSQKFGLKEFLITKEVSDAEEVFKVSIKHLTVTFSLEKNIEIGNDPDSEEQLVEEKLGAARSSSTCALFP